jgi:hypothetical protein
MEFWEQCETDAKEAKLKKIPLLFMRYNGMPSDLHFVMMKEDVWKKVWVSLDMLPIVRRIKYTTVNKDKEVVTYVIIRSTTLFKAPYKELIKNLKDSDLWPKRKK